MLKTDEGLIMACNAARAATEAYRAAADQDAPAEALSALLDRELALIDCVRANRAQTTAGLAAKAALLDRFMQANDAVEPPRRRLSRCSWRSRRTRSASCGG